MLPGLNSINAVENHIFLFLKWILTSGLCIMSYKCLNWLSSNWTIANPVNLYSLRLTFISRINAQKCAHYPSTRLTAVTSRAQNRPGPFGTNHGQNEFRPAPNGSSPFWVWKVTTVSNQLVQGDKNWPLGEALNRATKKKQTNSRCHSICCQSWNRFNIHLQKRNRKIQFYLLTVKSFKRIHSCC